MRSSIPAKLLNETIKHWKHLSPLIHEPHDSKSYDKLVALLDALLDKVGNNNKHELMTLIDFISYMIAEYDKEIESRSIHPGGINALRFLMEQHDLKQSDLPEIGSQGVVSEILNGKRKLNLRQIEKLATRFSVSKETFLD